MKHITEPSTIVDDLMLDTECMFRVLAGNNIGYSQPSLECEAVHTASPLTSTEFSFDPFNDHYSLTSVLAR